MAAATYGAVVIASATGGLKDSVKGSRGSVFGIVCAGMQDPNATGILLTPPVTEFGLRQAPGVSCVDSLARVGLARSGNDVLSQCRVASASRQDIKAVCAKAVAAERISSWHLGSSTGLQAMSRCFRWGPALEEYELQIRLALLSPPQK